MFSAIEHIFFELYYALNTGNFYSWTIVYAMIFIREMLRLQHFYNKSYKWKFLKKKKRLSLY